MEFIWLWQSSKLGKKQRNVILIQKRIISLQWVWQNVINVYVIRVSLSSSFQIHISGWKTSSGILYLRIFASLLQKIHRKCTPRTETLRIHFRNKKTCTVFLRVIEIGRTRNARGKCFNSFFEFSHTSHVYLTQLKQGEHSF